MALCSAANENLPSHSVTFLLAFVNASTSTRRSHVHDKFGPKLRTLELAYSSVRDSHMMKLFELSNVTELNLDSCPVSDLTIKHLTDNDVLPQLQSLDLADSDITDVGMQYIGAKFPHLRKLSLFYCQITNAGLKHLSGLKHLETLNLDSRDISDEGMLALQSLTKLKHLDVFSGRITDIGCTHLSKVTTLESLEL